MKILHTSDWHIGKHLHKEELKDDLYLFFNWLLKTIEKEKVDVLLVSGDIFDQANPSQSSLKQYYDFLKKMISVSCKLILTGGNHDSANVINAPKQLLETLDITVVGGAPESLQDLFIPFSKGNIDLVVAAVPFLKDKDIRKSVEGETYSDKIEQIKEGIKTYFSTITNFYEQHYSNHKFIVMGHLYVQGAQVSDSMREIQIGNQAGVQGSIFGSIPDYVALGHIHKPYAVSKSNNIYYCGSPISLSFSEKEDIKQVNLITIEQDSFDIKILQVPKFRDLASFTGTIDEVVQKMNEYYCNGELLSLGEIIVIEPNESIGIQQQFEELALDDNNKSIKIVKKRLIFENKIRGASDAFEVGTDIADVTPEEMFNKKLELMGGLENENELKNAFKEILQSINL